MSTRVASVYVPLASPLASVRSLKAPAAVVVQQRHLAVPARQQVGPPVSIEVHCLQAPPPVVLPVKGQGGDKGSPAYVEVQPAVLVAQPVDRVVARVGGVLARAAVPHEEVG